MSTHRLHIETSRWTKRLSTPINDRKCSVCNILEDEYHFILECQMFNDLKIKLIPDLYRIRPNMQKFVSLLNNNHVNIIKQLAKYMHYAFERRNNNSYINN